ncbi:hypothetical protein [Paraherbaspirillum soli]|uniref:Uncharacterized protein n=1 Tax=Paraherbaspirillum soli TaxID=631222 RepID=A0ABW0M4K9_9BURK
MREQTARAVPVACQEGGRCRSCETDQRRHLR